MGVLCDGGHAVTWVDAGAFTCGRMGDSYRHIPANTPNGSFVNAFRSCESFQFDVSQARILARCPGKSTLSTLPPADCADLGVFIDALEDSVEALRTQVKSIVGTAVSLHRDACSKEWTVRVLAAHGAVEELQADAVMLCPGSHPCSPGPVAARFGDISLIAAMDPIRLRAALDASPASRDEPWAVVGNSHSGMLAVKNLIEAGVRHVLSIYRSDLTYFSHSDDGYIR